MMGCFNGMLLQSAKCSRHLVRRENIFRPMIWRTIPGTSTVITAMGQTSEAAQVFIHGVEFFVTVQILDNTPAVLSLVKFCKNHGHTCEWASGPKATSVQDRECRSCCCPRIVFQLKRKFVFHIVPAGLIEYFSESDQIYEVTILTPMHRETEAIIQRSKTH